MKWKLKSSKPIFESPFIALHDNTYELPNGEVREGYYHMSRPDYVLILAISDKNRIIIEKQYRRGVDDMVYELPAGWIDKGESPLQAALRELKEETGYSGRGDEVHELYPQPSFCSMKAYVVILRFDEAEISSQELGDDEDIDFELKTVEEIKSMLATGQIKDMGFLSALGVYLANKE